MPQAAATSSTVVASKPRSANSPSARREISARVMAGGRPRFATGCNMAPSVVILCALTEHLRTGGTRMTTDDVARPPRAEGDATAAADEAAAGSDRDLVEVDLLVEDVSIDGMCG